MEIKCPKCRFRFNEHIPDYLNEASCVCPRCGTPFSYTRPTSNIAEQSTEEQNHAEDDNKTSTVDTDVARPNKVGKTGSIEVRSYNRHRQTANTPSFHYSKLILALAAFIALIIIIANSLSSPSNVGFHIETNQTQSDTTNSAHGVNHASPQMSAPKWLFGRWIYSAEFYNITVEIKGNTITETIGNNKSVGTYVIRDGHIIATYPNNTSFTYRLDLNNQQIDCGIGLLMNKTD